MREWIFSASVLILIITALRYVLKGKINPGLQYALWLVVLIRLLLPIGIGQSPVSAANIAPKLQETGMELLVVPYTEETDTVADAYGEKPNAEGNLADKTEKKETVGAAVIEPEKALKTIWLAGIGAVLLSTGVSNAVFLQRLRRSRRRLKNTGSLEVYVVDKLQSPCLAGLFKPAIYVTPELTGREEQLRHVILHETAHFRHGDHVWSFLRWLCLGIHWFNPLIWLAAVLSKRDGELACDEAVVSEIGDEQRFAYGRTLLLLSTSKPLGIFETASTMSDSHRGIKERIALLCHRPRMRIATLLLVLAVALIAVGCTYTGGKTPAESSTPAALAAKSETPENAMTETEPAPLAYSDSFDSTDGSVRYTVKLDKTGFDTRTMPIIKAGLHEFSADEARSAAKLIFGDSRLMALGAYEYSKEQIDEYLELCRMLEADEELLAKVNNEPDLDGERIRNTIANYGSVEIYEAAAYERDIEDVNWEFVPEGNGENSITAKTRMGDHVYRFSVAKDRRENDYLSGLYAMLDAGSLAAIPYEYYGRYLLTYEDVPDGQQIELAMAEAERIIQGLGDGSLRIGSCEARQLFNGRYDICINVTHMVDGYPLNESGMAIDDAHPERLIFRFGKDGTLIYFSSVNPCEKLGYISQDQNIIDFERAVELAKNALLGANSLNFDQLINAENGTIRYGLRSEVAIDKVEPGFEKRQGEEESTFQLFPCIDVTGHYEAYDETGKQVYASGGGALLLRLDAVDGKLLYIPNMEE